MISENTQTCSIDFIGKHFYKGLLKQKIHKVDTICAFTGAHIKEGILLKDLLSDVFTNYANIPHKSDYAGLNAAYCISDVIKKEGSRDNSLRNFSYFVTENSFELIKRENILELLLSEKPLPFVVAVSYDFKKHTTYRTEINYDNDIFKVTTDKDDFNIIFDKKEVMEFLHIAQKWYTIIKGKELGSEKPTNFTKDEILNGSDNYTRISQYGLKIYKEENEFLNKYRNTPLFTLVVHLLNKIENTLI